MGHCLSWFGCWFPSPWEHTISCPVCCCISFFFTHFIWHVHISIYEPFMDKLYGSLCTLYFALCLFTLHVYYMRQEMFCMISPSYFFSFGMSFLVIVCSYECSCLFLRYYIILLYIITLTLHI